MRPRSHYRAACVLIPVAVALLIAGASSGSWWAVLTGGLGLASSAMTLRDLRRKGVGWHGPKTFRELRELQARQARDTDA